MDIHIVTLVIIGLNVLVSIKGFNDLSFFNRYKFHVGRIEAGEKDRMFTSGFLHVDVSHLAFNMITLYFFADIVISFLNPLKFVLIYIVALASGSLLAQYVHKDEYHYSAVGASGAVMGILYAAILLYPEMDINFFFIPIDIPGYIFGIGYLLYSVYGMKTRNDNIGHTAHFGGAIGGLILTLAFKPSLFETELFTIGLLSIPVVLFFILHKLGKI